MNPEVVCREVARRLKGALPECYVEVVAEGIRDGYVFFSLKVGIAQSQCILSYHMPVSRALRELVIHGISSAPIEAFGKGPWEPEDPTKARGQRIYESRIAPAFYQGRPWGELDPLTREACGRVEDALIREGKGDLLSGPLDLKVNEGGANG